MLIPNLNTLKLDVIPGTILDVIPLDVIRAPKPR